MLAYYLDVIYCVIEQATNCDSGENSLIQLPRVSNNLVLSYSHFIIFRDLEQVESIIAIRHWSVIAPSD